MAMHSIETIAGIDVPDTALVREVQRDPITRRALHADIQRVGRSESITTAVPVIAIGVPAGVRDFGGVQTLVFAYGSLGGRRCLLLHHCYVGRCGFGGLFRCGWIHP